MVSRFRSHGVAPKWPVAGAIRYVFMIVAVSAGLSACAPPTRLSDVFVDGRPARVEELARVEVLREGAPQSIGIPMEMEPGDQITTGPDSTAVVRFSSGAIVVLRPDTRARLSSLDVLWGEVLAIIDDLRGSFEVGTADVVAGAGSTEYFVSKAQQGESLVTVLEGTVLLRPVTGGWTPVTIDSQTQARLSGGGAPEVRRLDREEFNRFVRTANELERIVLPEEARILVPSVLSLSVGEAGRLFQAEGLQIGQVDRAVTGRGPVGVIVGQSPAVGSRVRPESRMTVIVEAEPTQVPNLMNQPLNRARSTLQQRDLTLGDVEYRITGRERPDTIIGQTPTAGEIVAKGAAVNLVVEAESVEVPDLVGDSERAARQRLGRGDLRIGRIDSRITGRVSAGTVLDQSPRAGELVMPESRIDLVIEAESVEVPSVTGMDRREAEFRLQQNRLQIGRMTEQLRENVREGTVIEQTPRSGTRVEPGTNVTLVLAIEGRRVPSLSGLSLESARSRLSQARLALGRIGRQETRRYKPGSVIDQAPRSGELVRRGSRVDVTVAQEPVIRMCVVPSIVKLDYRDAAARIKSAGLVPRDVSRGGDALADSVVSQSPSGGTRRPCGDVVEFKRQILIY